MQIVKDKYVLAQEYLHQNPDEISKSWWPSGRGSGGARRSHCLFQSTDSMLAALQKYVKQKDR